jgi:hypothetical protein
LGLGRKPGLSLHRYSGELLCRTKQMCSKNEITIFFYSRNGLEIAKPFENPGPEGLDAILFIAMNSKNGEYLCIH